MIIFRVAFKFTLMEEGFNNFLYMDRSQMISLLNLSAINPIMIFLFWFDEVVVFVEKRKALRIVIIDINARRSG